MGFMVSPCPRAQGPGPVPWPAAPPITSASGLRGRTKVPPVVNRTPPCGWEVRPSGNGVSLQFLEATDLNGV